MVKADVFVTHYLSKEVVVGVLMEWRDYKAAWVSRQSEWEWERRVMWGWGVPVAFGPIQP